jgi:hypothetical protein
MMGPATGGSPDCDGSPGADGGADGGAAAGAAAGTGAGAGAGARARKRGRKPKPAPRIKATTEISRLQVLVAQHEQTVEGLLQSHRALAAKARAAQVAVAQCLALLRLGAMLQTAAHQRRAAAAGAPQPAASAGSGGSCSASASGGAAAASPTADGARQPPQPLQPPPPADPAWGSLFEQMRQQLEASGAARHVAGAAWLGAPASCDPAAIAAERAELGWSPSAAAALAPGADVTTRGLRRALRDFCQRAGHLYLKARAGSRCPDAAAARGALSEARARAIELVALIIISPDPSPLSEIILTSMDESEAPRRPAPASPDWMIWVTDQLELDEEQVCGGGGGGWGWGWGRQWACGPGGGPRRAGGQASWRAAAGD